MAAGSETTVPLCADTLPLTERQLHNLVALARLLSYVRFFHPSEGVAEADWNQVALEAIGPVEDAPDERSLAAALASVVAPVAQPSESRRDRPRPSRLPPDQTGPWYRVRHCRMAVTQRRHQRLAGPVALNRAPLVSRKGGQVREL